MKTNSSHKKEIKPFVLTGKGFKVNKSNTKIAVEIQDKVACIPSFIGKTCEFSTSLRKRFYSKSVQELRMEEMCRGQIVVW
jgi:hypothetical protein